MNKFKFSSLIALGIGNAILVMFNISMGHMVHEQFRQIQFYKTDCAEEFTCGVLCAMRSVQEHLVDADVGAWTESRKVLLMESLSHRQKDFPKLAKMNLNIVTNFDDVAK